MEERLKSFSGLSYIKEGYAIVIFEMTSAKIFVIKILQFKNCKIWPINYSN
jgi:hypothetical protein